MGVVKRVFKSIFGGGGGGSTVIQAAPAPTPAAAAAPAPESPQRSSEGDSGVRKKRRGKSALMAQAAASQAGMGGTTGLNL